MSNYAFIDSQNLNLGIRSLGWQLDYRKFRVYLQDKYQVDKAYLFLGYIPSNNKLYQRLRSYGYEIVFKPTVKARNGKFKGNIDTDLVLTAALELNNYRCAVVVSSDGDFYCLYKELVARNKLQRIIIPNKRNQSSLLKEFSEFKTFLEYEEKRLKVRGVKLSTG